MWGNFTTFKQCLGSWSASCIISASCRKSASWLSTKTYCSYKLFLSNKSEKNMGNWSLVKWILKNINTWDLFSLRSSWICIKINCWSLAILLSMITLKLEISKTRTSILYNVHPYVIVELFYNPLELDVYNSKKSLN